MGKYNGSSTEDGERYRSLMLLYIANELAESNRLKRLEFSRSEIAASDEAKKVD